ncbi:MAG: alpha-L-arabinofuranosidase C-terminal domain-containing protein [Verrucomicrobiae bacterium]|nr:alpha-L-arabinofuranosidase C-terminal domain-containing protein [Verrucomicrobiae bacterium]
MKISILLLPFAILPLAMLAADVTGTWKTEFDSQIGLQKYIFTFKQDDRSLTGKASSEVGDRKREAELKEGKVEGDAVSFVETMNFQENEIRITYTGKLSADASEIKFTRAVGDLATEEIVARRDLAGSVVKATTAKTIRIKAGRSTPYTDANGNVWLPEQGFEGGSTTDHDTSTVIAATKDAGLFLSEHYSMDSFSCKVSNGKYLAKLYFAETYDAITGPGERVFSLNVQGHEFKNFDVWVKAGGQNRAYVEAVPVEVTNGEFRIEFTAQVENPEINAIEIIPEGAAETSVIISAPVTAAPVASAPGLTMPVLTTAAATGPAATPVLQIDAGKVVGKVSPDFFGLMTEEINYSYEGGIYGELIRNRSFKADAIVPRVTPDTYEAGKYLPVSYPPGTKPRFWTTVGDASMVLDTNTPLNEFLNVSLKLDASSASAASPVGIANGGYWGIPVRPKTTYAVSFFAKAVAGFSGPVTLSIESADGKTSFASVEFRGLTTEWKKFEGKLKTRNVPASKENVFKLTTRTPGTLWLQNVSLFPPTYKNRPNGNRADIMELLAAMKPKFLRLPGGNYVEGNAFNQRFNWQESIGPVEQRPGHPSCWGYWSTDGMGILEYAEWCEDLDMEPVLAVFGGYCLGSGGHVEAGPKLEPYVQEALEEIEYLTGDAKTTKWGARRALDGHPKPFPLHCVEVGNEDFFDRSGSYEGRFIQFYDAIKAMYPNLKVISSIGHEQAQNKWIKGRRPDLVDEHFYRSQPDMEVNFHQYDNRSRAADQSRVFVGEWATRVGAPTPNMAGALGDAAWMCGMERNADVVLMECFAPLFVNVSQLAGNGRSMQWESDLIGYDALNSYGSPSYHVETMFAQNCGADILPGKAAGIPVIEQIPPAGRRGGTPPARRVPALYYSATRDAKSGIIYLKIVNVDGQARRINVQFGGATKISAKGEAVVLSAKSPSDTNLIDDRDKLVPHTEKVSDLSANFTREFPPYSITVLKLKTK